jgi:transposase
MMGRQNNEQGPLFYEFRLDEAVSERLLCREAQVNLAYRWFCKLGIEHKIPDHSVFSRARNERFRDSDIFRRVFERVVEA